MEIFEGLDAVAGDIPVILPLHPRTRKLLGNIKFSPSNLKRIPPLGYLDMIMLEKNARLIVTDSGGIQEEASSLGKPLLVLREVTERTEGIEAGTAILVGTEKGQIMQNSARLLDDRAEYERMARAVNPYGDGTSSRKIVLTLKKIWDLK